MLKRTFDVTVSIAALALLWPLLAVAAAAIRLKMGSPVLFRQQRPGLNGELFELVKFRTMTNGEGDDADRMTRLGSLLRSTSIDELPELWNVIRGDMSLVGPRPLLPQYLPLYSERQATRHNVRPGLTGLAQVSGRNATTWDDRLEMDAVYVESRDFSLDLEIVLQTITAVVRRDGITGEGEATMTPFTGSQRVG